MLVDAQRGSVALHFNQVETALNRMTYTAANNGTTLPGTLVCNESQSHVRRAATPTPPRRTSMRATPTTSI